MRQATKAVKLRLHKGRACTTGVADATGAYIDGGNEKCFSFYKPGPSRIGSEGGGVVWALHGLLCSGGKNLDDQAVSDFIASVKIDQ